MKGILKIPPFLFKILYDFYKINLNSLCKLCKQ